MVNDFGSIKSLASFIQQMNANDSAYSHYTRYKHEGVSNKFLLEMVRKKRYAGIGVGASAGLRSFTEEHVCGACAKLHTPLSKAVKQKSLGCPRPTEFSDVDTGPLLSTASGEWFAQEFIYRQYQAEAFMHFYSRGSKWTYMDLFNMAAKRIEKEQPEFYKAKLLEAFRRFAVDNIF